MKLGDLMLKTTGFRDEKELRKYLLKSSHMGIVEEGLTPFGGNIRELLTEFNIGMEKKSDMLARGKDNELVVIELKLRKADYKAFGQILCYILLIKSLRFFQKKYRGVRGIVLANKIDDSLKMIVKEYKHWKKQIKDIPRINLKEYVISPDTGEIEVIDVTP
ncbi:MAG: endonuclease NucS domain-containing protein [Candidatus Thermoplasmatota archaeon]